MGAATVAGVVDADGGGDGASRLHGCVYKIFSSSRCLCLPTHHRCFVLLAQHPPLGDEAIAMRAVSPSVSRAAGR